ncbi:MAG: hypothetical protein NVS4B2_26760 [Chloroflexota bacterium]
MSDVTDKIAEYKAGKITLDALAQWAKTYKFAIPDDQKKGPADFASSAEDWAWFEQQGHDDTNSFDEVIAAFMKHQLTKAEYTVVARAAGKLKH